MWRQRFQIVLGLLWILDGALQFQPYMFRSGSDGLISALQYNTMGPPNIVTDLTRDMVVLVHHHQVVLNSAFAAIQILIGLGLIFRPTLRGALLASMAWGLVVWVPGEALGAMIFPQASMAFGAPGAALLYIVASLMLWPRRPHGTDHAVADGGLLGHRGSLWAWAVIWMGTALLELQQGNHAPHAFSALVDNLAPGGPGPIPAMNHGVASALSNYGTEFAFVALVVQMWIGYAVLRQPTRKPALIAAIVVSSIYWIVPQNFGGILTGHGTDPNSGPLFVLLALVLWPWGDTARRAHDQMAIEAHDQVTSSDGSSGLPTKPDPRRARPDRSRRVPGPLP
ncbi:MAG: hypothetical protein ACYCS7_15665 [Acidimicrobiales bacterium]